MKVIGTAGHVDHGKSTLVLALTGIDPDRLAEEKAREMTIDLGFAWLELGAGAQTETVGVIDVPGHIDFIKNMLAGVGGIDAALFVIAADEGVMPQTSEHLAILDLLQVTHGVVALTKMDMVAHDPDWLELVQADIAATLADTSLAGAPIVPVSARTGQGLAQLKTTLQAVLAETPPRRDLSKPRLPIDRVFSVAGFGTVVTGTLSDGELAIGQEIEIVPAGLRARVRGLQTHQRKLERAQPGSRVAVNLSGVGKEEVARGQVVALPGTLPPTTLVDVQLRMVRGLAKPLLHNQPVDFFCGAAEVSARTRLLDADALDAGQTGWVQLRLDAPVAVGRGDRFILRQASPSRTLGGGVVVNPYPGRRWRRFRPEVSAMLTALQAGDPADVLLQTLEKLEPTAFLPLAAASQLDPATAAQALAELTARGQALRLDREEAGTAQTIISAAGWQALQERLTNTLNGYHRQFPLRLGSAREELKSRWQGKRQSWTPRQFNDLLAQAVADGLVSDDGNTVRLRGHTVQLAAREQAAVDRLLAQFAAQPALPPSVADSQAAVGEALFQWLLDSGQLVRISEDVVFQAAAYEAIQQQITGYLRNEGSVTVAQVRDLVNTSRKYALALMEHLDARRITRRVGDTRVLR
ncbi:MAG: selenocysteine-specific translation elongation factor [Anaerolineae bacterium]